MEKRIRYLHLSDNFYPLMTGGTEIFIQQFINAQISLGEKYEVMWACHKEDNFEQKKFNNLENYKIFLEPVLKDNRVNTFAFIVKEIPKNFPSKFGDPVKIYTPINAIKIPTTDLIVGFSFSKK